MPLRLEGLEQSGRHELEVDLVHWFDCGVRLDVDVRAIPRS